MFKKLFYSPLSHIIIVTQQDLTIVHQAVMLSMMKIIAFVSVNNRLFYQLLILLCNLADQQPALYRSKYGSNKNIEMRAI